MCNKKVISFMMSILCCYILALVIPNRCFSMEAPAADYQTRIRIKVCDNLPSNITVIAYRVEEDDTMPKLQEIVTHVFETLFSFEYNSKLEFKLKNLLTGESTSSTSQVRMIHLVSQLDKEVKIKMQDGKEISVIATEIPFCGSKLSFNLLYSKLPRNATFAARPSYYCTFKDLSHVEHYRHDVKHSESQVNGISLELYKLVQGSKEKKFIIEFVEETKNSLYSLCSLEINADTILRDKKNLSHKMKMNYIDKTKQEQEVSLIFENVSYIKEDTFLSYFNGPEKSKWKFVILVLELTPEQIGRFNDNPKVRPLLLGTLLDQPSVIHVKNLEECNQIIQKGKNEFYIIVLPSRFPVTQDFRDQIAGLPIELYYFQNEGPLFDFGREFLRQLPIKVQNYMRK